MNTDTTAAPTGWRAWLPAGAVIVVLLGVVTAALVLPANSTPPSGGSSPRVLADETQSAAELGPAEVVYEIEGSALGAELTIATPTGTEQGSLRLAWPQRMDFRTVKREVTTLQMGRGEFVYLSAQNVGELGTVTCRIVVDGEVIAENTSSGSYAVASCSGTA